MPMQYGTWSGAVGSRADLACVLLEEAPQLQQVPHFQVTHVPLCPHIHTGSVSPCLTMPWAKGKGGRVYVLDGRVAMC